MYSSHYHLGLFNCLVESNRVLQNDGLLFITTPNTASWGALHRSIRGESNYLYWPHVREYAPMEFVYYLKKCGFEIVSIKTFSPYPEDRIPKLFEVFLINILSTLAEATPNMHEYRGSTMSIVAKKVRQPDDLLMSTEFREIHLSDLPCFIRD